MKIDLAYGKETRIVKVNPDTTAVISLPGAKKAAPLSEISAAAINNPTGSASIKDFLHNCRRLLVIVNDSARGIPSAQLLEHLYPHWQHLEVKYIVATGAHRNSTELELEKIFGSIYHRSRKNIFIHDSENDEMTDLGVTSFGTPVKFNHIITEVDKIINLNSVEPHYFAGYTGGRKSFQPGIASYQAIEVNHSLAMQPGSSLLELQGNPVHDDMMEAVEMIEQEIFSINTVLNSKNEIIAAVAGNWKDSFYETVKIAEKIFLHPCSTKADIFIAVVQPPLDEDLYQAQKGIENCRKILKKNGILILVAACPGGIGKDQFYQLLSSSSTPQEVFERIAESYKLGYHKAARLAEFTIDHQLWMVTDIPQTLLDKINVSKFTSVQQALDQAILIQGKKANIIINQDAGMLVPVLMKDSEKIIAAPPTIAL